MTTTVLERVRDHLQDAGLLAGYTVRFYRWTDGEQGAFIVLRYGGAGTADYLVQRPDVRLILVTDSAASVRAGEVRMYEILRFLRGNYRAPGLMSANPVGGIIGPSYLEDGRGVFELNITAITDNQ